MHYDKNKTNVMLVLLLGAGVIFLLVIAGWIMKWAPWFAPCLLVPAFWIRWLHRQVSKHWPECKR